MKLRVLRESRERRRDEENCRRFPKCCAVSLFFAIRLLLLLLLLLLAFGGEEGVAEDTGLLEPPPVVEVEVEAVAVAVGETGAMELAATVAEPPPSSVPVLTDSVHVVTMRNDATMAQKFDSCRRYIAASSSSSAPGVDRAWECSRASMVPLTILMNDRAFAAHAAAWRRTNIK